MVLGRLAGDPQPLGQLEHRRALQHRAVLEQRDRQAILGHVDHLQQLARLAVALHVEPGHRDSVAGEEVAHVVGVAREAMADDPHSARLERSARLPGGEQVLDHRVELLLGRVPGLEQVVVERDVVDRRDRGLGVRVGGEQDALGVGHQRARLDEVVGARHAGHALIGDQHGRLIAARAQLGQQLQRLRARAGAEDAVALAEVTAQVARDRAQHSGLVIDGNDRRASLGRHGSKTVKGATWPKTRTRHPDGLS